MILSVCIPNYERLDLLTRLVSFCCVLIEKDSLYEQVEICVSDDCSSNDPTEAVHKIVEQFPSVCIKYKRNETNLGMDHNFLQSVMMASGRYAWIIGNDDMPTDNSLSIIMDVLKRYPALDFLVSPFDAYSYTGEYKCTVYPLKEHDRELIFDTTAEGELSKLIYMVEGNTAFFDFLSNVVFLRKNWVDRGDFFKEKMNSIFIQIYMNLQSLKEGAVYVYSPGKIIRQYLDKETNSTYKRRFAIVKGLDEVVNYFFAGSENRYLHNVWVDLFVTGMLFDVGEDTPEMEFLRSVGSDRVELYVKYFVKTSDRKSIFRKKRVVICGAGVYGRKCIEELRELDADIMFFCDRDESKQRKSIEGIPVKPYSALYDPEAKPDYVLAANKKQLCEMVKELEENGIYNIAVFD